MIQRTALVYLGIALVILVVTSMMLALTIGPAGIPLRQTVSIMLNGPHEDVSTLFSPAQHRIIWHLRLPRILTAALAGVVLAISGMVYQALFRNPMADPYVLGISSGAAFGVAFAAFVGFVGGATGVWQVPVSAFIGSIGTALLILLLSGGVRRSPTTLLLSGIALNFLLSALMTLFMYLNRAQLQSIMQWTLGNFGTASWDTLVIMGSAALVGLIPILLLTRELDILLLDEASARSLGVDVRRVRLILLVLTTLATSITVAFCGVIGFVGLMVPHIMRMITGPRHRDLLWFSMLGGAFMTVTSDTIARIAISPSELPVGVITAIAGSPLFFILLINNRRRSS